MDKTHQPSDSDLPTNDGPLDLALLLDDDGEEVDLLAGGAPLHKTVSVAASDEDALAFAPVSLSAEKSSRNAFDVDDQTELDGDELESYQNFRGKLQTLNLKHMVDQVNPPKEVKDISANHDSNSLLLQIIAGTLVLFLRPVLQEFEGQSLPSRADDTFHALSNYLRSKKHVLLDQTLKRFAKYNPGLITESELLSASSPRRSKKSATRDIEKNPYRIGLESYLETFSVPLDQTLTNTLFLWLNSHKSDFNSGDSVMTDHNPRTLLRGRIDSLLQTDLRAALKLIRDL